jgi:hypothetical protein
MSSQQATSPGFLTRMFLRDCAFLKMLYGPADSRSIWSYAVFGFAITLAAFAMLVFFAAATYLPAFPATLHPATASKEILWLEAGALGVSVWWGVEYGFRGLKDQVTIARRALLATNGPREMVPYDFARHRQHRRDGRVGCWMAQLNATKTLSVTESGT